MRKILTVLCLGAVAFLAGLVLQCASDVRSLNDGGAVEAAVDASADRRPPDSEASADDWFKISYVRDGKAADTLATEGSSVQVTMGYRYVSGKVTPALTRLRFTFLDDDTEQAVTLAMSPLMLSGTGTFDLTVPLPKQIGKDAVRLTGEDVTLVATTTTAYLTCGATTGTTCTASLTISKFSKTRVAGTFDVQMTETGTGSVRKMTGSFDVAPVSDQGPIAPRFAELASALRQ